MNRVIAGRYQIVEFFFGERTITLKLMEASDCPVSRCCLNQKPETLNPKLSRYQIVEFLGAAAFSKAVQCIDLTDGSYVCVKIIKNNKDFFDQSLDEIKILKFLNAQDSNDDHNLQTF